MTDQLPPMFLDLGEGFRLPILARVTDGVLDLALEWEGGTYPLTVRPDEVPAAELPALTELLGLAGTAPVGLIRVARPLAGAEEISVPGAPALAADLSSLILDSILNPTSRFPLVEVATISHPAPPAIPDVRFVLARYDAALAARADAHDALETRGRRFGWLRWRDWAGALATTPWSDLTEPARLLAIAETRERQIETLLSELKPYYAAFHEPVAGMATCASCTETGEGRFKITAADAADALTATAGAHSLLARTVCGRCLGIGSNGRLEATRAKTLAQMKEIWHSGRLASGSFSADLHALNVLILGKEGYFTVAERQAKELVDMLTDGEVTDLTADKLVSGNGADALFFARRGLFTKSDRSYIAVEVKTTNKIETLKSQLNEVFSTVRNAKCRALFEGRTYTNLTKVEKQALDARGPEIKRWYRYYVANYVFEHFSGRTDLSPAVSRIVTDLGRALAVGDNDYEPVLTSLEQLVESVLVVRFTSLDARAAQGDRLDTAFLARHAAVETGTEYFDSQVYFDLFGAPIEPLCDSSLPGVDRRAMLAVLGDTTRMLLRLRQLRHERNHPDQYPLEAVTAS